ncbi:MAG: hypothetical protein RLZZ447_916 [Verrucomicrobiota bacterium]
MALPLPGGFAARLIRPPVFPMNAVLLVLALAALAGLVLGGWLILKSVQSADDGFEDETGFHLGPEPMAQAPASLRPGEGPAGALPR